MRDRLLHWTLIHTAERLPHKEFIKHKSDSATYDEFLKDVRRAASVLANIPNSKRGDRIAIYLEKSINQAVWIYAASMADRVFVLISDQLKHNQVEHIVRDCDASCIIYSEKSAGVANTIAEEFAITTLDSNQRDSEIDITNSLAITDDDATIIYTSGSTGYPKGIVISHRNLIDGIDSISEYLGISESDRLLGLLPFNFDYGLNQLTTAANAGSSIVLHTFFVPGPMLKLISAEKITGVAAIPTIWAAVFNPKLTNLQKVTSELDFSSLRYITNSGGKIPVPTISRIRELFQKTKFFSMYGLTEAFRSTFLDPELIDSYPDSMGKAIPGVQIEVVREDGSRCDVDEPGELIHRGALISKGYLNNPEKTAAVFRPNPLLPAGNQYLEKVVYSGDLVKRDENGLLYYIGRKDNMIKISGYRVSPTEVEDIIIDSTYASDAIAFGVPDEELGYHIRAVVVFKGDDDINQLYSYFKKVAPSYLIPKEIIAVDGFPKTASGKIDRPQVIKRYMNGD